MAQQESDVRRALAALRSQRLHWVDVGDGRRVQYRRPLASELGNFGRGVTVEHVVQYACGWEGFTEATILGAALGASDELPFDKELWAEYVRDEPELARQVVADMARVIEENLKAREDAAKN